MIFNRIKDIRFKVEGYTSTFEYIKYGKNAGLEADSPGRVKLPYIAKGSRIDPIDIGLRVSPNRKRNVLVFLDLEKSKIPSYLNVNLRIERGEYEAPDLFLTTDRQGIAWFEIVVRHEDRIENPDKKEKVKICIRAGEPKKIPEDIEGLDEEEYELLKDLPGYLEYEFMVGPAIGDTWLGIDPGTTGSCIVGSHPSLINTENELLLHIDEGREKITASRIAFDQEAALPISQETFLEDARSTNPHNIFHLYETGDETAFINAKNHFQSIKKLLGFTHLREEIEFSNGEKLALTGSELTGLMVRKLFEEFNKTLSNKLQQEPMLQKVAVKGHFKPNRAVVAIPNNFSPLQIQDAVDAIRFIPSINEVRTIYESEAVLVYCLRNKN